MNSLRQKQIIRKQILIFLCTFTLYFGFITVISDTALAESNITYPEKHPNIMGEPILDPSTTTASIYNDDGTYAFGKRVPNLPVNIIKYRFHGKPAGKDITIDGKPRDSLGNRPVDYIFANDKEDKIGATIRMKNVGVNSKGEKVVICISSNDSVVYRITNNTGSVYVKPYFESNLSKSTTHKIWFETEDGKKIDDDNSYFLIVGYFPAEDVEDINAIEYKNFTRLDFKSGKDSYLVQNKHTEREYITNHLPDGYATEFQAVKYNRAFNLIFKQSMTLTYISRDFRGETTLPLGTVNSVPLHLLSSDQLVVMTIPMPPPYVISTKNDSEKLEAQLDVSQEIPIQDGKNKYPDGVELFISLPDSIDLNKIDKNSFNIETEDSQQIPHTIDFVNNNKIHITVDQSNLQKFSGKEIHVRGNLPLDINYPGLFDNIDENGYIMIDGVTVKNDYSEKINTNTLYVKEPKEQQMKAPYIQKTKNDNGDLLVDLDAVQEIPQTKSHIKWPNNFTFTINLPESINSDLIDEDSMSLKDEKNTIGQLPIEQFVTRPTKNIIKISLDEKTLNKLGSKNDNKLHFTSKLHLNFKYPGLFDNKDSENYLRVNDITVKNSVVDKENTETLLTKTMPPTADMQTITVPVGTDSKTINVNDYVKNLKSYYPNDTVEVKFAEDKIFSEVGEKKIKVELKSKNTGDKNILECKVIVREKQLTTHMTVKQVYNENNQHLIYQNIVKKIPVDNSKDQYDVQTGKPLKDVLNEIETKNNGFNLTYDGYVPSFYPDYKVLIDGVESTTETVPDKDFTLLLEYDGTVNIEAEDLSFDNVPVSLVTLAKFTNFTDNYVTLTDTNLTAKTGVQVKMLDSLKLKNDEQEKDKELMGGLFIQKDKEITYLSTENQTFYNREVKDKESMVLKLPMNMGVYQNLGNVGGKYEGTVQWSIIDGPGSEE